MSAEGTRECWSRETPYGTEVRYVELSNPDYQGITDLFWRMGFSKEGIVS
jgi:hypothetical protein